MPFSKLEDIPKNARLCIYGSGQSGQTVAGHIRTQRPDVTIVCFLDTFRSGQAGGLKVIKRNDLPELEGQYDIIFIASAWWRDIVKSLKMDGINNSMVAALSLWHKYVFTPAEMELARQDIDAVEHLLETTKDKTVFRFLMDARKEGSPLVKNNKINPEIANYQLLRNSLFSHLNGQYTDFVNRDAIKTVLHAGVFNGEDCLRFLDLFPNVQTVHGFEPLGEKCIPAERLATLKGLKQVSLHYKGLWNSTGTVEFQENGASSSISIACAPESDQQTIDVTSIDDFVNRNGIAKVDHICLDVEGAEWEALEGARNTIATHRPQLAICIYHLKEDIYRLPLYLDNLLEDYVFHIGHYYHFLNETVWYALPKELADTSTR
ncbi:MAG: FkbM family methyltransferase [Pseudodesulfovibrio sp.]|nr:FkbM family methyltransferase [Pseudodesulfovibrio sp.]